MTWLIDAVVAFFLNKVWAVGSGLVVDLWNQLQFFLRIKKITKINDDQASRVESAADEIKRLIAAGLPVSEELKERLRAESRKLIDGSFPGEL